MMATQEAAPLSISIALCTYNGGRYLREQLASLENQTYAPIELVVCDDGSTDDTLRQLAEFQERVSFPVSIIRNATNLGYSRNFQNAIRLCTGDIIALSDQDDRWHPHKLDRLSQAFAADPKTGGIFSDGFLMDAESRQLPGTLWASFDFRKKALHRFRSGDAIRVLLQRNVVTGMAFAFRCQWREALEQMPEHWPHDFWLALMLAEQGALRACPEQLVTYRVHQHQQIGVPITRAEKLHFLHRHGVSAYLNLSRERNVREYLKDAIQFESLMQAASSGLQHHSWGVEERESMGSQQADPNWLRFAKRPLFQRWWMPLAREKARHMRRGVQQLQQGRLRRFASVLYHWKSYYKYAPTGFAAMLRDLLL